MIHPLSDCQAKEPESVNKSKHGVVREKSKNADSKKSMRK